MCLMSFDHCFALRGQGTVLTGTMLQGKLAVGDVVEILPIKLERKVKSIQRFKTPVDSISSGDRAGVCVTKIDASDLERGLLVSPPGGGGTVTLSSGCIIEISQVRFYKGEIRSHSNFHISIGYETTVGKVTLFGAPKSAPKPTADDFFRYEFEAIDAISSTNPQNIKKAGQYDDKPPKYTPESYYTYAMIEWKTDMYIPNSSLIIGSKLDSDPISSGEVLCTGTISGLFGKTDKFRVQFPTSANLSLYLGQSKKTKAPQQQQQKQKSPQCMLLIKYRKFLNSALAHKKIDQKFTS
ncbi:Selenocysteine-specific elongation factor [Zancudomyces culisetae]|uniref:Selenocysteine-specific elongation factor n=1 Tax=Zancudomyces culisetae TaxID=1213189 RepID=A0A1R1PI12_ZANCU|nr:Selenocysteine-specific elongation factor [Zancudomyces culisetae]|eukprot:OMH80588.1 Selenocysteine-specific elongation factor [Zancudomyces culisetae]